MFEARLKQLKKNIKGQKLDGVFISSQSTITYLTGYSNFSKDEREAYIFVGENFEYLITDGRYTEALKQLPYLKLFQRGGRKSTEDLLKKHKREIKKLGIEEDNLTVLEVKLLKKHFQNLKHFSVKRSIKEKNELEKIEKACTLGDQTFKYILKKISAGITEKQLAFEIEFFIKKNGGDLAFPAIVAFGKNSSIPHHQTGDAILSGEGQFILLDFGVRFENYCSDMTRTIFLGEPTFKQKRIYQTVLKAQQKAEQFVNNTFKKNGEVEAKAVDKVARRYITAQGFPTIPHSLGHGIGLEVHEHPHLSPKSKEQIKVGMVFSIEPGIYIPGYGGIRLEDLFVLEKNGLRQLTTSPKNLIKI